MVGEGCGGREVGAIWMLRRVEFRTTKGGSPQKEKGKGVVRTPDVVVHLSMISHNSHLRHLLSTWCSGSDGACLAEPVVTSFRLC